MSRSIAFQSYRPTVYSLFLLGKNTAEIAALTGRYEHEVEHDLNEERSRAKGLPFPYEVAR